jgi:hypothetical protein
MEIGLRSNELGGQELVGTAALASAAIRLPAECLRFIEKSADFGVLQAARST